VLALEGFFMSSPLGGSEAESERLRIAASWLADSGIGPDMY
jgi:hypothetical protein